MKKSLYKIPLEQTRVFSSLLSDYLSPDHPIASFAHYATSAEGLQKCMNQCTFPMERRTVLKDVLREQYHDQQVSDQVRTHIESITSAHTFFVTTGQQIHVLGGPLYVLYKIASTIRLAEACKRMMPDKHFIPLFWMASEDHDLEEIDHLNIFGKRYQFELKGKGPAGRISTEGLEEWMETLPDIPEVFKTAYKKYNNLSDATRYWLNDLFGNHGLVVLDADHPKLKQEFIPVIEKELFEGISVGAVREQTVALEEQGYKSQIFPREINLFYISPEGRNRITYEDGMYTVLNTSFRFNQESLTAALQAHPESFSPNVVLRPVYQEYILPNIAYIGGPAEVAYWMQLGKVFEALDLQMPVVLPRNFAMVVSKPLFGKLQKLSLHPEDVFLPEGELKQHFLSVKNQVIPDWEDTAVKLDDLWSSVEEKTLPADGSLKDWLAAEKHKVQKQLESIEKRVVKTYEQKLDQEMKQLAAIKEKLLPGGSLQERSDSFLSFIINDPAFIGDIISLVDPLDFRFNIVVYED
ncbi:MAG TPA: bacillithiol biosynthesis cysteine-adding enzyme BshC [Cytophagaceae bacterium]|jgi:bacillithiol biosynthesis cysteine-adding enzyme BshC|nr:bacillithiol biosynthesis cysteine-adding enzyme BshC [Cytophagaceae bacterium]